MTSNLRPLIAGNWKMNGLRRGEGPTLATFEELCRRYTSELKNNVDMLICPPATMLQTFAHAAIGSGVSLGGQDCHQEEQGAHTGDISAFMLCDSGAQFVIVGHSERRQHHGETDALVSAKVMTALKAGLIPIICVGESRSQREQGKTLGVIQKQLRNSIPESLNHSHFVVAYEPVWAIGTGLTPTPEDVSDVHALMRREIVRRLGKTAGASVRLLYGGSVKPGNAAQLLNLPDVNGALIGGASLVAADFLAIASATVQ